MFAFDSGWWVMTGSNRRPTPCKGAALPTELITPPKTEIQFKASFNALPGRNLGTLAALILIAAPVRGLRPVRAARLPTAKVPKPTSETESPFLQGGLHGADGGLQRAGRSGLGNISIRWRCAQSVQSCSQRYLSSGVVSNLIVSSGILQDERAIDQRSRRDELVHSWRRKRGF